MYKSGSSNITAKAILYANGIEDAIVCYKNNGSTWSFDKLVLKTEFDNFSSNHTYHFQRKTMPANGSASFDFTAYSSGIFLVMGYSNNGFGIYMIMTNGTAIYKRDIAAADGITVTNGNNTVTFANSTSAQRFVLWMTISGKIE